MGDIQYLLKDLELAISNLRLAIVDSRNLDNKDLQTKVDKVITTTKQFLEDLLKDIRGK